MSPDGASLPKADLILTNRPFGTKKGGGRPNRADFSITADTSNKQLAFVEHVVRALKPGGKAAVVVPDNVLSEDNTGRRSGQSSRRLQFNRSTFLLQRIRSFRPIFSPDLKFRFRKATF